MSPMCDFNDFTPFSDPQMEIGEIVGMYVAQVLLANAHVSFWVTSQVFTGMEVHQFSRECSQIIGI